MSFINNKKNNIISAKVTEMGRRKIAMGNLSFSKWAVGDSEINYTKAAYHRNNASSNTARILLPADSQPNIKYFISNDINLTNVKTDLVDGDINLIKLNTKAKVLERGLFAIGSNFFETANIKYVGQLTTTNIQDKVITFSGPITAVIGDYVILEALSANSNGTNTNGEMKAFAHSIYSIVSIAGNSLTLNRKVPKLSGVTSSCAVIVNGGNVLDVPNWNSDTAIEFNGEFLNYDLNPATINNTKPWSFNVVTVEELAGYIDYRKTKGYSMYGIVENYLSYNDDLNIEKNLERVEACSDQLISGYEDPFKKLVGIIHFENMHHSNLYGDSFFIDNVTQFRIRLPYVLDYSKGEGVTGIDIVNTGTEKTISDSTIKYYDMTIEGSQMVIGKVFPELKMCVIDDEELVTALSIGSGRNFTLPTIEGKLSMSNDGLLPSGKQMYVTYSFRQKTGQGQHELFSDSIHCNKYMVIQNTTLSDKDVELRFTDINKFTHMINPNVNGETGFTSNNFEILYQITNVGERPHKDKWLSSDFTGGLLFMHAASGKQIINPIPLTTNKFMLNKLINTKQYDLSEFYGTRGYIGDDTVLLGNVIPTITSIIYKSLIQVRLNANQYTFTTNPTKENVSDPVIVSEVGIYDDDEDLVMIAKLSTPIELTTKSSILLEISMDF